MGPCSKLRQMLSEIRPYLPSTWGIPFRYSDPSKWRRYVQRPAADGVQVGCSFCTLSRRSLLARKHRRLGSRFELETKKRPAFSLGKHDEMFYAIEGRNKSVVQRLLDLGVDPNTRTGQVNHTRTPLFFALQLGDIELAQIT